MNKIAAAVLISLLWIGGLLFPAEFLYAPYHIRIMVMAGVTAILFTLAIVDR